MIRNTVRLVTKQLDPLLARRYLIVASHVTFHSPRRRGNPTLTQRCGHDRE
jgi:hypothetical protein